jgi:urate oxidase
MASVGENRYGKEGVRLVRVRRSPYNGDTFDEWTVRVLIEGDFASSYAEADNSKVLPTDTMKNTVYYLAQRSKTKSMEEFAKELVNYLIEHHTQVSGVTVDVESKPWSHIITSNNVRHPTAFVQTGNEIQLTTVKRSRHGNFSIVSGLKDLKVMKTANTSFVNFYRDALTTLADSRDRLFGTAVLSLWTYQDGAAILDFDKTRQQIRSLIIDVFAEHESESVQHTMYDIGKYILKHVQPISKIHFTMPNLHCLSVDLTKFGEPNKNEIFMPIDEPHGYIQCTIVRSSTKDSPTSKL